MEENKLGFTGCTHEKGIDETGECLDCGNDTKQESHVCDRCGSKENVELHYWAPETLFDDFAYWPKNLLCKRCLDFWGKNVYRPHSAYKPSTKIFGKGDIRKAMAGKEGFEVLWLDIPDIEKNDARELDNFLLVCLDEFKTPLPAYLNDGWKVVGTYKSNGVERLFALRPVEKPKAVKKVQEDIEF
jgi:hypothetical protein